MDVTIPGLLIQHDPQRRTYVATLGDEEVSRADYAIDGRRVILDHTETAPQHRGNGFAATVVRFALDDLRDSGKTVVPACSFVRQFVSEHPEYRDLLDAA
jgi:predicted GNAT family acetyltransferase